MYHSMLKTICIDKTAVLTELSKKQCDFIAVAVSQASKSNNNHFKHGCVAVRNGKIIGKGFNHNRIRMCGKTVLTVHAELDVIYSLFLDRSKHMIQKFTAYSHGISSNRQWKGFEGRPKRSQRRQRKNLKHNTIDFFVVKVNQNGDLTESRPCGHCVITLQRAGIRKCYYSTHDGNVCVEKVEHMRSDYVCMGHTRCLNEIELWKLEQEPLKTNNSNQQKVK